MAQNIILKRSSVAGKVPTTSSLSVGEVAINTYDGKLFIHRSGSTKTIQEVVTTNTTNTGSISLTQTGSFGELAVTQDANLHRDLYVTRDILANGQLDVLGALTASLATGYTWVGNGSNISKVVATSSFTPTGTISSSTQILNYNTFATTGSNTFVGSQTITGSFLVSGSTTQIGNNTIQGNNYIYGNNTISGSNTLTGSNSMVGTNNIFGNTTMSGSIIISGSDSPSNPTIRVYGDMQTDGVIKFDPVNKTIDNAVTASYIYVSGSTNDLYFTQNNGIHKNTTRLRWLEGNLYTGLLNGGVITSQSVTTYQISSGSGLIVTMNASLSANPYPTIQYLNWQNLSASITPLSASYEQSYVAIQSNGTIFAQGTPFVDVQYDTMIPIGLVLHQNHSTINGVKTSPSVAYGYTQRASIFTRAFGPLKLSGYVLAPSGSSTGSLVIGSGTAYSDGANYTTNPESPSYITDSGTTTSKIFRYYNTSSYTDWVYDTNAGAGYGAIDPTRYSANGVLTLVPGTGSNKEWSIQRVYWYPNSATKAFVVFYGNATYADKVTAYANISVESFVEAPNTAANAIYVGAILVRKDADFTDSATYQIVPGGLFRSIGGTGGGGAVTSTLLSQLGDTNINGVTDGQPLVYNTSQLKWINSSTLTADLVGNATTATTAATASHVDYSNVVNKPTLISGSSQLTELNTFTGSATIRLNNLETTSASVNSSVTNLNSTTASYETKGRGIVSGSSQLTSSYDTRYTISGSTVSYPGPNTFDFNLDVNAAGTVNYIQDSTSTAFVYANPNSISASIGGTAYLTVNSQSLSTPNTFTASLANGYTWVGNGSNISIAVSTSSFASTLPAGVVSGSSQVVGILSSLNTYTGSNDTTNTTQNGRLTNLETTSASVNISVTNLNSTTASAGIRLTNLETTSASVNSSITNINSFTSSNANTSLNTYTASATIRLNNLETTSASVNSSVTNLNSTTASAGIRLTNLETTSASVNISVSNLNTFSASNGNTSLNTYTGSNDTTNTTQNSRLTNLEITSASVNSSITNINTFTSSNSNTSLNTYTASATIRLTNLETTSASVNTSVSNLNTFTSSFNSAIQLTGSNVNIAGNLTVAGTQTTINSTTLQIGDNIIELNGTGVANGGLYVKDPTAPNTGTGSLLWDSTNDYWKGGFVGSEEKLLRAGSDTVVSSSAQVVGILSSLNTFTSSASTRLTNLETTSASVNISITNLNSATSSAGSRITNLETTSASVNSSLSNLNTETASIESRFTTLASVTSSYNSFTSSAGIRLTNLETTSASVNTSITNINTFTASNGNTSLNTYTASATIRLTNLETTSASVNTSVTNLNTYSASVSNSIQQLSSKTGSYATTGSNSFIGNQTISGSLTIGSASVSTENTLIIGPSPAGGSGEGGQILLAASGGLYTSASMLDNWQNQTRLLRGTNAGSDAVVAAWNMGTKQMQLPAYINASSFTGTATANLAVNSNGDVITVSTTGASVFPYTGNAVITGSLTTTGIIYATPNGGMYFQGGDDAALYDINISNHMGIYGVQDSTVGSVKLGSGGGIISGKNGNIGIGTIDPLSGSLHVNGNIFATSVTGAIAATNGVVSGSSQVIGILSSLNTYTSSATIRLTNLETTSASVNSSVTNLNTFSASNGNTSLNTYTGSNDTTNTTQNNRLTNLETTSASVNISVSNLNAATSSYETKGRGIVSSSAQITPLLPTGVISGSSQLSGTTITNLTITNLTTVNETASVVFSSGSNTFGDFGDDIHRFTGSVQISGSLNLIGSPTSSKDATINTLTVGLGGGAISTNTAVGASSLNANTTGYYNVGLGYRSLITNTTGANNTGTGFYTLYNNIGGSNNTANGSNALFTNTSGYANTGVGVSSLHTNTTGYYNTAVGYDSLYYNTTGGNNTGIGVSALLNITTASNNTALGASAGRYITGGSVANITSSNSVYLGNDTNAKADGDTNEIVIGYATTGNGSNTVTIGNSSITANYFNGGLSATSFTGSIAATNGVISGSSQVTPLLPTGTVSGSSQVSYTGLSGTPGNIVSGAIQVLGGTGIISGSGTANYLTKYTGGTSAGNSLIYDTGILIGIGTTNPSYVLDVQGTGRFASNLTVTGSVTATSFNGIINATNGVISGSSQLTSSYDTRYALSGSGGGSVPAGTISGSSQLTSSYDVRYALSGALAADYDFNTPSPSIGSIGYLTNSGSNYTVTPSATGVAFTAGATTYVNINSQSLYTINTFTASLANGYTWVGNGSNVSIAVPTSSFSSTLPSGIVSGSSQLTALGYATTGSNTFVGTQIVSGSTYITGDLVVYGSSSIQNISASSVNIGTNTIELNTNSPSVRFAGLSVHDSGSAMNVTGSLWWDSFTNNWIYQHESGSTYSGGTLISGPKNTGALGSEVGLTTNYLQKAQAYDHLTQSVVYDDGTNIGVGTSTPGYKLDVNGTGNFTGNLTVTGSLNMTGSGTTSPTITPVGTFATNAGNTLNIGGNLQMGDSYLNVQSFFNSAVISNNSYWANIGGSGWANSKSTTYGTSINLDVNGNIRFYTSRASGSVNSLISYNNPFTVFQNGNTTIGDSTISATNNGYNLQVNGNPTASGSLYVNGLTTLTGSAVITGSLTITGLTTLNQTNEVIKLDTGFGAGTRSLDLNSGSIFYLNSLTGSGTWNTINVPTTSQRATTMTFVIEQGATAYSASAYQINSSAVTVKWVGGTTPTGNANKTDVIGLTAFRSGSTWNVLGALQTFG